MYVPLFRLKHECPVVSAVFSPDLTIIATGALDSTLRIWSSSSGDLQHEFRERNPDDEHCYSVHSLVFHPSRTFLAYVTPMSELCLRETVHWSRIDAPKVVPDVRDIAFSNDGKLLALGYYSDCVNFWNVESQLCSEYIELTSRPTALAFSTTGRLLAIGTVDGFVKFLDVTTREMCKSLQAHEARISSIAFSPTGGMLVTASDDGKSSVLESHTWRLIRTLGDPKYPINSFAFSPDGVNITFGMSNGDLEFWNVSRLTKSFSVRGHITPVSRLSYSGDGKLIASIANNDTPIVWAKVD